MPRGPASTPSSGAHRPGVLYVLAKEPAPGFVKTRLCPPLTPERAAGLAAAFAADVLSMAGTLREVEARLAVDPDPGPGPPRDSRPDPGGLAGAGGPDPGLAALASRLGLAVEGQGPGDLGQRMARLMERGLGAGPTILVGTDCPDLPPSAVRGALAALGRCDVVLGPAADGGYWLVGARRPVPSLFAIDAPWSSDRVLDATSCALSRARCAFELLETREDVDDAAALGRLASRLQRDGEDAAPQTARLLARWRGEGEGF